MTTAEKEEVAQLFIDQKTPMILVLKTVGIPLSTWYYKPKEDAQKKGRNESLSTFKLDGSCVDNDQVVLDIKECLGHKFVDYGYLKVTHWLRQKKGYNINAKKVYRLMRINGLLQKRIPHQPHRRIWVKDFVPNPNGVFEHLELDIKDIWVGGKNRNLKVLTVIDVKSRWVLGHVAAWSLKKEDVIALFKVLFESYPLPKGFYLRSDNGSQFIAEEVQKYFETQDVQQEFCRPATPQQNAHIESYHSIVERVVCQRFEFESLEEAQETLTDFVMFYNYDRIHSGIDYKSPEAFLIENGFDMEPEKYKIPLDCAKRA